jgi:methylmalonyl-CoA mutase
MGLFETFDKVSHQDWLNKIIVDLKGKDYNDTLVWKSDEGIDVQPFYNDWPQDITDSLKTTKSWKIRESITISSFEEANQKALLALKGGADSILFIGRINTQNEMDILLKDIQTDIIEVHFYNSNPVLTASLVNLKHGSISYDNLNDIDSLTTLISSNTSIKTITVSESNYSSTIEEIALNLAKGVEYLNLLTNKGIEAKQVVDKMQFTFGIGTNYFFEIAKIRAARILWATILEQYNITDSTMAIHSETSVVKDSKEDENYNILRNTTKAMSAIIGGCDSLTVRPHDDEETKKDFSNRIARNIHHILKEEAFFDKVSNPADGSYYIEEVTEKIASKAWKLFQEIENKGGFLAYTK